MKEKHPGIYISKGVAPWSKRVNIRKKVLRKRVRFFDHTKMSVITFDENDQS